MFRKNSMCNKGGLLVEVALKLQSQQSLTILKMDEIRYGICKLNVLTGT